VPMHDREEEIVALPQILLDAADDGRAIGITDLFRDYPDRVRPLVAEKFGR